MIEDIHTHTVCIENIYQAIQAFQHAVQNKNIKKLGKFMRFLFQT